jgi:hypothetical protein
MLAADLLNRPAVMSLGVVAGGRDLGNSQVDSQEVGWFDRVRGFPADLDVQEEPAFPLHELSGRGLGSLEHLLLTLAGFGLDPLAGMEQHQADRPVPFAERKVTGITVDRRRLERQVGFLRNLEGGTDTGDGPDRQVGGEPERLPDLAVAHPLDQDLVGRVLASGHVGDVVVCFGESTECGVDLGRLIGGWLQFQDDRPRGFHGDDCISCHGHMSRDGL